MLNECENPFGLYPQIVRKKKSWNVRLSRYWMLFLVRSSSQFFLFFFLNFIIYDDSLFRFISNSHKHQKWHNVLNQMPSVHTKLFNVNKSAASYTPLTTAQPWQCSIAYACTLYVRFDSNNSPSHKASQRQPIYSQTHEHYNSIVEFTDFNNRPAHLVRFLLCDDGCVAFFAARHEDFVDKNHIKNDCR